MDRFYSSVVLYSHLFTSGTGAVGTILSNRRGYPKNFRNDLPSNAERGLIRWFRKDNIVFISWKDKKEVKLISSVHSASDVSVCNRQIREHGKSWEKVQIPQPQAIKDYNTYMGGVDLSDQLISYYTVRQKTLKYYKTLFFHCIDIAVTNSYILHIIHHESLGRTPMDHRTFNKTLAEQLVELYDGQSAPMSVCFATPSVQHLPVIIGAADNDHSHSFVRRRCFLCTTKGESYRSAWQCQSCSTVLCLHPDRNCFHEFHTSGH
jgi:hypothetical protein